MSGGYFAVDTAALAKAAPEVARLASRVHSMSSTLSITLNQLGNCWGNDEIGSRFAEQYLRASEQMVEGLVAASKVLNSTAEGISTMSKGFTRGEERAVEAASFFEPPSL